MPRRYFLYSSSLTLVSFRIQHLKITIPTRGLGIALFSSSQLSSSSVMGPAFISIAVVQNSISIPGHVIPKTLKIVLDAALLSTQHYKVMIEGKVVQSRAWSSPPLHLGVVAIEKEAFGSPSTKVANFTYLLSRLPHDCLGS